MLASVGNRLAIRLKDVALLQRASATILELGTALDARLLNERRPAERLRMLRETTNRITRTANDAIQAYDRASRAVAAELERPDTDPAAAREMRRRLDAARAELMAALQVASRRYPPVDAADALASEDPDA